MIVKRIFVCTQCGWQQHQASDSAYQFERVAPGQATSSAEEVIKIDPMYCTTCVSEVSTDLERFVRGIDAVVASGAPLPGGLEAALERVAVGMKEREPEFQQMREAIRASERITEDDLRIVINV